MLVLDRRGAVRGSTVAFTALLQYDIRTVPIFTTTANGRIICGGQDEPFGSAADRDALLPKKTASLERWLWQGGKIRPEGGGQGLITGILSPLRPT